MTYIEELEDYRAEGVRIYSIVDSMDFYYGEVRASGVTILENLDGKEVRKDKPEYRELKNKLEEHIRSEYDKNTNN